MGFAGFADPKGTFFKKLAKNQSREWFKEHKETYEKEWAEPMLALLAEVRTGIDAAYSYCELDEAKVFRIYRDVRFGKDKSPFKTVIAGRISVVVGNEDVMEKPVALYLQVGSSGFAAAGHYLMPKEKLARFRTAVTDPVRGKELTKIMGALTKKGFTISAAETLTRVPRGFDPDHPQADILKMKGLIARFPPLPDIGEPAFAAWLRKHAKLAADLVTWTTYACA